MEMAEATAEDNQEPGIREAVIRLLWEKQFEGTPWAGKFHLLRPSNLVLDYGSFADKIIATVRSHIEECFELKDRRRPGGHQQEARMFKDHIPINDEQIIAALRAVAMMERNHKAITWEHGVEIINMVAKWGDRLAGALEKMPAEVA